MSVEMVRAINQSKTILHELTDIVDAHLAVDRVIAIETYWPTKWLAENKNDLIYRFHVNRNVRRWKKFNLKFILDIRFEMKRINFSWIFATKLKIYVTLLM